MSKYYVTLDPSREAAPIPCPRCNSEEGCFYCNYSGLVPSNMVDEPEYEREDYDRDED